MATIAQKKKKKKKKQKQALLNNAEVILPELSRPLLVWFL